MLLALIPILGLVGTFKAVTTFLGVALIWIESAWVAKKIKRKLRRKKI